ncbi:acyltransferase [Agrobacterium sp. a22-2]|uniref:acyltransferase family protein n=1 Tax=Agrobacterium sp. a22-2 TaxID=2283840 RepID=UPI001AEE6715|nr:acyltransferase [Agrobacterium sp. a22-2]
MRLLLISGIVFVHVPYDPQTSPFLGTYGMFDWLRIFLGDSLFRVGVPCLSAISGFLLFRRGLDGFDYARTTRSKAMTVLVPFLIWNLSFLLLVYLGQRNGIGFGYVPDVVGASWRDLASHAFALEAWPINVPLYFLRDLLLCLLLSPALGFLVMRFPGLTLAVLLAYAVLPVPNGIFLKKSILFGFSIGIYAALHKVDIKRFDSQAGLVFTIVLAISVALATALYQYGPEFPVWLETARSLAALTGILGAWCLSALLTGSRFAKALSKGGGLSFWIFCAHYPLLVVAWMVWNRSGLDFYPLFYITAPVLVLIATVLSNAVVKRTMPQLYGLLTGSRSKSGKVPPRREAPGKQANYTPQER